MEASNCSGPGQFCDCRFRGAWRPFPGHWAATYFQATSQAKLVHDLMVLARASELAWILRRAISIKRHVKESKRAL